MSTTLTKQRSLIQKAKLATKLLVTGLLVYLLLFRIDFDLVQEIIPQTRLWIIAAAFVLFLARNLLAALRWQVLLSAKGYTVTLAALTRFYLLGNFFGLLLPTAIGGDIARGYYSYRAGISKKDSISAIVTERALGIAAMMVFALVSVFWGSALIDSAPVKIIIIVPSTFCLLALLLFFGTKLNISTRLPGFVGRKLDKLLNLIDSIRQYNASPRVLIAAFVYSILYQVTGIVSVYLIAIGIGSSLAFVYFLMLLPVVWLMSMIPVSLNGLGIREGTFVFLFVSVGLTRETAVIISSISLLQSVAQGMIGGLFFLWDREKIATIKHYSRSP
jgi:glycosyltransferase 2 family protein